METGLIIGKCVAGVFLALIGWTIFALVRRGLASGASWARTTGRVTRFSYSHGVPELIYEYKVNGKNLEGGSIVTGVAAGGSRGAAVRRDLWA